jgi:myo-inositol-1(or 4)-monophosphatase
VNTGAPYTWVLDPIDGTKSFIAGMPAWGTLIGLLKDGAPVYGMMSQPFIGERFTGDGASAKYRGRTGERKLMTRPCSGIEDALLFTTSPQLFTAEERKRFESVEKSARLSRYGGDCYAYCMVAAGYVDLVIEAGLDAYDIMPLIPIIEGAGGAVTNWQGESAAQGGQVIAAGDKRVLDAAIARLNA